MEHQAHLAQRTGLQFLKHNTSSLCPNKVLAEQTPVMALP